MAPPARTTASNCSRSSSAGDVHADIDVGLEDGAFGFHLLETAVDVPLLHLELGDAVAQQAADAVCPLEDRHCVTGAGQLLRCSQTGRATADNCDLLVGGVRGANRLDPPFVEGLVDDLDLDLLDGDRILVDAQDTGRLTGCGAQTTGELREVVGRVQTLDGVVPVVLVNQVVPLGNQVSERATVVAERNSAVHATAGLGLEGFLRELLVDLFPVEQAQRHRPANRKFARRVLQEAAWITHELPP